MSIQPEGEEIRKAVRWISEEHRDRPSKSLQALIEEACMRFNLSPKDAEYLQRFFKAGKGES